MAITTSKNRCDLLLLPVEIDLLDTLRDRSRWFGTKHGAMVSSEEGTCRGKTVVIGRMHPEQSVGESLAMLVLAHHPRRILAVGPMTNEAKSCESSLFKVNRVVSKGTKAYELATIHTLANDPNWKTGELQAEWAYSLCQAASEKNLSIVIVAAELDKQLLQSKNQSLARRTGAMFGRIWRRPSEAGALWKRQTERWEIQARLADAIELLLDAD